MNPTNTEESHARAHEYGGARRAERNGRAEADPTQRRRARIERMREVGKNLSVQLDEQVHKRPYAVLGAALGVGFVAGSVFGSRLGQVLLAAGMGYVAKHFLGPEFGIERIQASLEKLAAEAERVSTPS